MAIAGLFTSCNKDDKTLTPDPEHQHGKVVFNFKNHVGEQALSLQALGYNYQNANGDSFRVTAYKYYVSNVRFVNEMGVEYSVPESYYLIDQSKASSFDRTLTAIPAGNYTAVKMLLGVDSTHNVSGAQAGDLDPIHGMFWTWNTGYIMAKVEGNFKKTNGDDAGMSFHLGGFAGTYSVLREVTISLPQTLVVGNETQSTVSFKSDVLKWFGTPHTINFQQLNQVGSAGIDAANIADNYSQSLSVTSVQN